MFPSSQLFTSALQTIFPKNLNSEKIEHAILFAKSLTEKMKSVLGILPDNIFFAAFVDGLCKYFKVFSNLKWETKTKLNEFIYLSFFLG